MSQTPTAALLRVGRLNAYYGKAQALFGLQFDVAAGEIVALIGRNGAGKSTTLKAIIGLVHGEGELAFDGHMLGGLAPHARARLGLGFVPEDRRIFTELTVRENLIVGARSRRLDLGALLTLFPNLREMLDRSAAQMSGGEQQMLALARTLVAGPRLVLLDEPSEGIAPRLAARLAQALRALREQGVGVLLSEQNPGFVAAVADRALLLEHGHLVGTASRDELVQRAPAVRAVLGL